MIPLLSIIIPVYNTEQYVERCLNSVLFNKDLSVEVICINDGSTDNSLCVLKAAQKRDSRIIVINQENKGVSIARNNGLRIAKGKWIMFVDSDDMLLPEYYDSIINHNDNFDFIMFDAVWGDKKYVGRETEMVWNNNTVSSLIGNMLLSKSISEISHTSLRSPCIKVYKRDFLNKIGALFPERIKIGEDMLFNLVVFANAETACYAPVDIYKEIDRVGSATHSFIPNMINNEMLFQNELKKRLVDLDIYNRFILEYYSEVKSGIVRCLRKQIFNRENKYTRKEKIKLLHSLHNNSIFAEAIRVKDNNFKRNIVLFLYKINAVFALNVIFNFMDF